MRRLFLGNESRFVESVLGRITLITLFTTLFGVALALIFLVDQSISPTALKFASVAGLGLAASLMSRRLLAGRNGLLRFFGALFAVLIAFGVLNVLTHGYIGVSLLHAAPAGSLSDSVLQLLAAAAGIWLTQRAWTGSRREVMVEPRGGYDPEPPLRAVQPPRVRRGSSRLLSTLNTKWSSALRWTQHALAPSAGTVRTRRKVNKPARRTRKPHGEIALSANEQHVCPYCLEPVFKRDPRGVKICKVCKTWHHADCWAITGVCQVPHQYVS